MFYFCKENRLASTKRKLFLAEGIRYAKRTGKASVGGVGRTTGMTIGRRPSKLQCYTGEGRGVQTFSSQRSIPLLSLLPSSSVQKAGTRGWRAYLRLTLLSPATPPRRTDVPSTYAGRGWRRKGGRNISFCIDKDVT